MNVLVLGGRSFVALEIVRNLGRRGHRVFTAESIRVHPAGWSRYVHKNFHIPPARFATERFIQALDDIIQRHDIDMLIPTCEETFYVSHAAPVLTAKYPNLLITCGSYENISLLHDKLLCSKLSSKLSIPTPRTYLIRSHDDLVRTRREFKGRKVVLKRRFSRFGSDVYILEPPDNGDHVDLDKSDWLCQEYIDGSLLCTYTQALDGDVSVSVLYESPFSNQNGVLTAFTPVDNGIVNSYISKIARELSYSGSLSFDFIMSGDGVYLIECNPRVTSGVHCLSNNDFYGMLKGKITKPRVNEAQVLLVNAIKYRKWPRSRDVVFQKDDLLPILSYLWLVVVFLGLSINKGIKVTQATTYDIEWNGEESLIRH